MDIRELKDKVPITKVLRYYGWAGQAKGWANSKKTKCPFHPDENPSAVYDKGRFMCFGCGARGDIIDLVSQREGLDVKGAIEWLKTHFL